MAFLEVECVSKYFSEANGQELLCLQGIAAATSKSEFVTMVGHSGCGKSHAVKYHRWPGDSQ